jgi:rSAM/selenodomain-associated transferase 1
VTAIADRRLLVFARAPRPGRVKTRLIPALGDGGAARLYRHLLLNTLAEAMKVPETLVELWCHADDGDPAGECAELAARFGMTAQRQRGADLGGRMHHALAGALKTARRAVLIGSDCPEINSRYLACAFAALEGHEAVLGPAADGGYVLIGLRKVHPRIFVDMPWGTDRVLDLTRARLGRLDWRWSELPTLRDLDRAGDLDQFPQLGALAAPRNLNRPT